jgi:hypothetical protein
MVKKEFLVELLDTTTHKIIKQTTLEAKSPNNAIDKFALKIHKSYDLTEMRTPKYARYVILASKKL